MAEIEKKKQHNLILFVSSEAFLTEKKKLLK